MIWCVEDDASIRDIEVYVLRSVGFEARGFSDGAAFWDALRAERPELVVLDVMLPGIDGIELLSRMRASDDLRDIPVIMATAKDTEYDKIHGLDLGADYYLAKPFGVMELVSCVKAVLRRCRRGSAEHTGLSAGGVSLDADAHTVTAGGQRITLTYKEFELLRLLRGRDAHCRALRLREGAGRIRRGLCDSGDTHVPHACDKSGCRTGDQIL